MNEPRFSAKTANEVPPPVQFACSYTQALEALEAVRAADNDKYFMGQEPVYALRAGTNETRATTQGLFVIHCEQRVRDGSEWQISAGEVFYMDPGKRAAFVRESFAPFPVKSNAE
jgi:hypothetical protein